MMMMMMMMMMMIIMKDGLGLYLRLEMIRCDNDDDEGWTLYLCEILNVNCLVLVDVMMDLVKIM